MPVRPTVSRRGIELAAKDLFNKSSPRRSLEVFLVSYGLLAGCKFFLINQLGWNVRTEGRGTPGIVLSNPNLQIFTVPFVEIVCHQTLNDVSKKHFL